MFVNSIMLPLFGILNVELIEVFAVREVTEMDKNTSAKIAQKNIIFASKLWRRNDLVLGSRRPAT